MTLYLALIAALLLTLAGYAQYRIGFHTAGASKVRVTRAVLALIGVAFGLVMAAYQPGDYVTRLFAFLIGFGAVHFPAAVILFVKRARGEGRS